MIRFLDSNVNILISSKCESYSFEDSKYFPTVGILLTCWTVGILVVGLTLHLIVLVYNQLFFRQI